MHMDTAVELRFGDGRYRFWLSAKGAADLEHELAPLTIAMMHSLLEQCMSEEDDGTISFALGGAIGVKAMRMLIREALREGNCGMVDGAEIEVGPLKASELVDKYVYPARPLEEGLVLAAHILFSQVRGIKLKKKVSDGPAPQPAKQGSTEG